LGHVARGAAGLALHRGGGLALAFLGRLFVELALAGLGEDAGLLAGALEATQGKLERLVFADFDAGHKYLGSGKQPGWVRASRVLYRRRFRQCKPVPHTRPASARTPVQRGVARIGPDPLARSTGVGAAARMLRGFDGPWSQHADSPTPAAGAAVAVAAGADRRLWRRDRPP